MPPWPPYSSGISIPISPISKNCRMMSLRNDAGLVHLAHVRADLLARELADGGLEKPLLFAEGGKRQAPRLGFVRSACIAAYSTGRQLTPLPALRLRHAAVRHVAVIGVDALAQRGDAARRPVSRPQFASSSRYGKVAFVSANVEVCGTAAGMFETQ